MAVVHGDTILAKTKMRSYCFTTPNAPANCHLKVAFAIETAIVSVRAQDLN